MCTAVHTVQAPRVLGLYVLRSMFEHRVGLESFRGMYLIPIPASVFYAQFMYWSLRPAIMQPSIAFNLQILYISNMFWDVDTWLISRRKLSCRFHALIFQLWQALVKSNVFGKSGSRRMCLGNFPSLRCTQYSCLKRYIYELITLLITRSLHISIIWPSWKALRAELAITVPFPADALCAVW